MTTVASDSPAGWSEALAFGYDTTDPRRVRVQAFEGSPAATAEFDSRALVYIR